MPQNTIWFVSAYLLLLPIIGWWARARSREFSLKDYYLAGASVGLLPLFFTLYAAQYSGNTMLGFAGKAYRSGFIVLFGGVGVMMLAVVWSLFAKKLHQLSRLHNFITIGDYFNYRYNCPLLHWAINLVLIAALASYILTNFIAIGWLVVAITGGAVPMLLAMLAMAVVMAFYESVGGVRGVIATDVLQGSLLLCGCLAILAAVLVHFGGVGSLISQLQAHPSPSWQNLDAQGWRTGVSIIVLFATAVSVYPHAIQRIYTAKNWRTLKYTLVLLFCMPLFTTLPIVISAMSASLVLSIADGQSDQVLVLLIGEMSQHFPQLEYLLALFMAATVAAIMSTIDSALLALNSFITKDLAQPLFPTASQQTLVATSKKLSWLLMLGLAAIASVLPQNIWAILIVKIEAMAQVFPALLLGLSCPTIQAKPILLGLLLGVFVTVWLKFFAPFDLHGIHAGTWGLLANFAFVWLLHLHQNGGWLLFIKK